MIIRRRRWASLPRSARRTCGGQARSTTAGLPTIGTARPGEGARSRARRAGGYRLSQRAGRRNRDDVWAVGGYGADTDFDRTRIVRWDGKRWKRVRSPNPGSSDHTLWSFPPVARTTPGPSAASGMATAASGTCTCTGTATAGPASTRTGSERRRRPPAQAAALQQDHQTQNARNGPAGSHLSSDDLRDSPRSVPPAAAAWARSARCTPPRTPARWADDASERVGR